jgi:hypothetical protein
MSTTSNFSVTLSKPGRSFGVWAGRTGGEVDRDVDDYFPGAMLPARKLVGTPTTGDVTVRKLIADLTDDDLRVLLADQQNDTIYTIVTQRLTSADRTVGGPWSQQGVVKTVTPPDADSGGGTDAAELSVVLSMIGTPTVA